MVTPAATAARWSGTIDVEGSGGITVNGGANSAFNNDGNGTVVCGATIGADVISRGSFGVSGQGKLEFMKSVGPNQSVSESYGGIVQIDQPTLFAGSANLGFGGEIDLIGLANADSYSLRNDMLSIYTKS